MDEGASPTTTGLQKLTSTLARFISRFSSRFGSRPLEEKLTHTACFVIVLLLFPYFARTYISLFVGVTYAAIVVPTLISANSRYPPTPLKHLITPLLEFSPTTMTSLLSQLSSPLLRIERTLLSLPNLCTLLSQLSFFSLSDHLLLSEHRISSLYTLIFYNVLTYCVSYVTELATKESWDMYVTVSDTNSLKHLSMTATKLVLEWTKAITFLITVVFLVLVVTLERALDKYFPTKLYLGVTFLYYIATEKFFVSLIPRLLSRLDLTPIHGLEDVYSPLILRTLTLTLSSLSCIASLFNIPYSLPLFTFLNLFIPYRHLNATLVPALRAELSILRPYRLASQKELEEWNDICPICLSTLTLARTRVTPCFHLFHGECLRRYLKVVRNETCPMCKKALTV
ncbi:hypothetical protein WDU94_013413 [Cyamophila willieti]